VKPHQPVDYANVSVKWI